MDRLTKIVVLLWICAAIAFQTWAQRSGWPNLPMVCSVVAIASLAAGWLEPRLIAAVLGTSFVVPVLLRYFHVGASYEPNQIIWITAFVGVLFPSVARSAWHIPARWRASLVAAALVVVVTSPIVVLREIDMNFGLLRDVHGWSFAGGTWPSLIVTWTLYSSLTLVIGIVWFDWLFSAPAFSLERYVATPLAVSAFLLVAVLVYQLLVDISFLNDTVFGVQGRATGTLYDANLSGTIAALLMGGLVLFAVRLDAFRVPAATVAGLLAWLGVWASGSRTAFGAALIVTFAIAVGFFVETRRADRRRLYIPVLALAVAALVAVIVGATGSRIVGPASRVWATMPSPNSASIRAFVTEMWNRNRYGLAATELIRDNPLFGVGVGTYATVAVDAHPGMQPDNAQNWLRHQIVEFGAIGSLGWLTWTVTFALFVLSMTRRDSPAVWITRGMLVAFGAISMFGMPGQTATVAVAFWTIAFWYCMLKSQEAGVSASAAKGLARWVWTVVVVVPLLAAAGTAYSAVTRLRPPERVRATKVPWGYGFGAAETAEGGAGYRLTRAHAVAVVDVSTRWLSVSVRSNPKLTDAQPVDVRVWANGGTVLKAELGQHGPLTTIVALPDGVTRIVLEAAARRADSHRPFFIRSEEALYFLKWEFLDHPPADFNGAGYHRSMSS